MVSKLKHFSRDPMFPKMNRGSGYYYNRGNLKGFPHNRNGEYWSKYNESIDAKKAHLPTKTSNIVHSEMENPHKGDFRTRKKNGHVDMTRKTTRLSNTTKRGFF